jgi:hypothetical protein
VKPLLISLLGAACGILLAAGLALPARATQINVNANECQFQFTWPQEFVRSEYGISTTATGAYPPYLICAVPRSPTSPGTLGAFYVDGDNYNGAFTSCSLYSFAEDGSTIAQVSFRSEAARYDAYLSLAAEQMDPRGYVTVNCLIPPNGNGVLRGITSLP